MKAKNLHTRVLNITFIALFAALCYIALTLFFFPFAQMYIHFGNLIVVVAALLIGGWQGGLAGSVGMGLYDILNGHADSSPKTFLLKFLIGLTIGIVYTLLSKTEKFPKKSLIASGIFSLVLSIALIICSLAESNDLSGKAKILYPIFMIIGILCVLFSFFSSKFSNKTACAIIASICGMAVNIIGETLWKTFQFYIAGASFTAAFTGAVFAQGSTLINAGIAIIGGVALFGVLEKPFAKILK